MHFGENQLSPRSFGISPLPTAHPSILNHRWVRASSPHYRTFTLAMGSSRGFGSARRHKTPSSDSLSLRLRASTPLTSRNTEQLAGSFFNRHAVTPLGCSDCLWAHGFRNFASPFRGAFHLSLTVLFAIGRRGYVALEGGPPSFPRDSSCPAVLRCPARHAAICRLRDSHPLRSAFPGRSTRQRSPPETPAGISTGSYNPQPATPAGLTLTRFGLLRVRSPLLAESRLISCPRGTEMFQFPRLPLPIL